MAYARNEVYYLTSFNLCMWSIMDIFKMAAWEQGPRQQRGSTKKGKNKRKSQMKIGKYDYLFTSLIIDKFIE